MGIRGTDIIALARAYANRDDDEVVRLFRLIASKAGQSGKSIVSVIDRSSATTGLKKLPSEDGFTPVVSTTKLVDVYMTDAISQKVTTWLNEYQLRELLADYHLPVANKILLVGNPGNGKTSLALAIANEIQLPVWRALATELIDSHMGVSGVRISKLLAVASRRPSIVFMDELESISSFRKGDQAAATAENNRITSTMLLEMDALPSHVVIIAATNRIDLIDVAMIRRFDCIWNIPGPTDDGCRLIAKRWQDISGIQLDSVFPIAENYAEFERSVIQKLKAHVMEMLQ